MNPRIGKLTYTPRTPCAAVTRVAALGLLFAAAALAQFGGELRFCLHGDPKTFDPLLARTVTPRPSGTSPAACCCASIA
jgi:hypothetical protein